MVYERRHQKLLPRPQFARRVLGHVLFASIVIAGSLAIGMIGYHYLGHLGWVDSYLNATMILGGMGPVDPLKTTAAKLFAGTYALFAGLIFLGMAGVVFAPFVHRLLHRFHIDTEEP
jgi:hypothetical protein